MGISKRERYIALLETEKKYNQLVRHHESLKKKYAVLKAAKEAGVTHLNKRVVVIDTSKSDAITKLMESYSKGTVNKVLPDQPTLEKLVEYATLGCTYKEIASGLGVSLDALTESRKTFYQIDAAIDHGREMGKIKLRGIQWKQAETNVQMSIWLGKNMLQQTDRREVDVSVTHNVLKSLMDLSELDIIDVDSTEIQVIDGPYSPNYSGFAAEKPENAEKPPHTLDAHDL